MGGNVHARALLLRYPEKDVEAARLGGGLLAQAEHILVEDSPRRHPHDRRAVGRGAARARAFVLEKAREGDGWLVGRCEQGRAVGAVEGRGLLVGQRNALLGGETAQVEFERDQHGQCVDAHPPARAGHDGPLVHLQAHLGHDVRGELRGVLGSLARATGARGVVIRRARVALGDRAVVVRHSQLPALACLVRLAPLPCIVPPIDGGNLCRRARQARAIVWWHLELVVHEHRHVEGVDRAVSGDLVVARRGAAKVIDARSVEPIAQPGERSARHAGAVGVERLGAGDVEALVEDAVAHFARVGVVAVSLGDILNEPQRGDDLHQHAVVRPMDQVAVSVRGEEVECAGEGQRRRRQRRRRRGRRRAPRRRRGWRRRR
eukprot:scaffold24125_cov62-Phaeocystis_antarctica.AAC.2